MNAAVSTPSLHTVGQYVQIAGAVAFLVGVILSLQHYAIGICFIAGAAGFFIGKKLKAS